MLRFFTVLSIAVVVLLFVGCGGGNDIKKGDRFEVLEELKEAADIQTTSGFSDGFSVNLPKGTILTVLYNKSSSEFVELSVEQLDGKSDHNYITEKLLPERIRNVEGFRSFSVTLSTEYIGTKLKKL